MQYCDVAEVKALQGEVLEIYLLCKTRYSNTTTTNLCLRFNGHFPGEPGLAGVYWSKGWWRWWWQVDYWSYKLCKAPVKSSPPANQHPVSFTGRMSFMSPNQQCQSTEEKNITFHGLAYPELFQLCLWPVWSAHVADLQRTYEDMKACEYAVNCSGDG